MRFEAIRLVHPEVTSLEGDNTARDINANIVSLDETAILIEYDKLVFSSTKQVKVKALKQSRDESNTLPVVVNITDITTSTTADYNFVGGYESAQMLDGKRTLVKESFALGLIADDNVSFRDTSDAQLLMSMTDATKVVLTVANEYEANFQKYKDLKTQIANATTSAEVDLIVW